MTQLKKKDIRKVLERVKEDITDQIEYPNYGGCAVIAAIVGKHLQKYIPVESVVDPGWCAERMNLNKVRKKHNTEQFNSARDWNDIGVEFGHVLLKFKLGRHQYVFDTDDGLEKFATKKHKFSKGALTLQETKVIAGKNVGWNWTFDRKQIIKIGRIVRNAFKMVEQGELTQ